MHAARRTILTGATGGLVGYAVGAQGAGGSNQSPSADLSGTAPVKVSVRRFGALGDGRTDDTNALQAAIDSVVEAGGEVHFEPGRYLITRSLRVRSLYPVALTGEMPGQTHAGAEGGPAIVVGRAMESMIEYSAPDPSQRDLHGSGLVRGLAFVDPTHTNAGSPGTRAVSAALHLRDFSLGLVERCSFHWIRGSAIRTEYAVMTTVRGCRIRYCGDAGRPERSALYIAGSSPSFTTQSFLIDDCRIEVCYGAHYISILSPAFDVAVRACFFEAATSEYPASSNTFLGIAADRFLVESCTFNRTDAVAVKMHGRGKLLGCTFANGIGRVTSLELSGDRCIVANCTFEDNRETLSINCSGVQNQIASNIFYYSGGVRVAGRGNVFANNLVSNPRMQGPGWWLDLAGRSVAEGNRFDGNGSPVGVGGIVSREGGRVANNSFDRWSPHPCIDARGKGGAVLGNSFADVRVSYARYDQPGS